MASRRVLRRRYAVIGVLAKNGPMRVSQVSKALRCPPGKLFADLAALEREEIVISYWSDSVSPTAEFLPRFRYYRLRG